MDYYLEQKPGLLGKFTWYLLDSWNHQLFTVKIAPDRRSARILDASEKPCGAVRLLENSAFNSDMFVEIALYNQPIQQVVLDRNARMYHLENACWNILRTAGALYIDRIDGRDTFLEEKTSTGRGVRIAVQNPDDLLAQLLIWTGFQLDHKEVLYSSSTARTIPVPDIPLPKAKKQSRAATPESQTTAEKPADPIREQEKKIQDFLEAAESLYRELALDARVCGIDARKQQAFEKELNRVWRDITSQCAQARSALQADPALMKAYRQEAVALSESCLNKARETAGDLEEARDVLSWLIHESSEAAKTGFDREIDGLLDDFKRYI